MTNPQAYGTSSTQFPAASNTSHDAEASLSERTPLVGCWSCTTSSDVILTASLLYRADEEALDLECTMSVPGVAVLTALVRHSPPSAHLFLSSRVLQEVSRCLLLDHAHQKRSRRACLFLLLLFSGTTTSR